MKNVIKNNDQRNSTSISLFQALEITKQSSKELKGGTVVVEELIYG